MKTRTAVACVAVLVAAIANAQEYKPAVGPLLTKWAKDVSVANALPEYPRPQQVRPTWANLNGLWDYAIAAKEDAQPRTWEGKILVPFPIESALSGVMKRVDEKQRLWYRRTWSVPADWKPGKLLLHFGAVDWDTVVYVNGKEIGKHRGGYDPFTLEVTDSIKRDAPNEIVVAVFDPTNTGYQPRGKQVKNPGGIFYTPCTGIWQTVWIEPVPVSYIPGIKITPTLDSVKIDPGIVSPPAGKMNDFFKIAVLDGENTIAQVSSAGAVDVKIPAPKLWSHESPHLYRLIVQAGDDKVESYFGLRKIEVKKDDKGVNRIFLNGKAIFMVGPLDQGFWPDGIYTAPTDEALKFDIEITKKLGFNCTRKHVKVEPARWYYWCDKLGLLVWQDMPSGDNGVVGPRRGEKATDKSTRPEAAENYKAELKDMIDAFYNHPSIIMWVVFNEGWGQFDTIENTTWTKKYDPSRLVNPASGWNDYPAGDVIDQHAYPAPKAPAAQDYRAQVLGEFGGLGLPIEGHMWTAKHWGYRGVSDQQALTKQYGKLLAGAWALKDSAGLNAAIYTQITDVETEANGLLTYDRAVVKVDLETASKANQGRFPPPPQMVVVVPTSQNQAQTWRFTVDKPADDWFKTDFNDSGWKEGPGGFGTANTPGTTVKTEWKTPNIWIRRTVELPAGKLNGPVLMMHHDEDVEVYINGVLAVKATGFTTGYEEFDISKEAQAALKPGKNVIAVHCKQTMGGQYIDVGISDAK